jgi:peptidoglycan hydrolase-like protein with peptidoglycan-binding domain
MPFSGQPLKIGMRGDEVKRLQASLQQLGMLVAPAEHNAAEYGERTAGAVAAFQAKHGLPRPAKGCREPQLTGHW